MRRGAIVSLVTPFWVMAAAALATSQPRLPDLEKARQYFTDTELTTQDGTPVRFFTDVLAGKVVVINGFYTNCHGLSPRQSQVLASLQTMLGESLGKDVFIVSVTVDPKRDSVDALAEYARGLDAGPGWLFLTGEPEAVDRVNAKLGQYHELPEDHRGVYVLGNVETGLWMKVPLHAMARDLYLQIQRLLEDEGEPPAND